MIRLGLDSSGSSINKGATINGINEAGQNNIYFNSVYIGGSPTSGSSNTFAFTSSATTNSRNYRDNIFYNARSNGGSTGKHYSVTVGGSAPNPSGLTINNNVYLSNGSGGVFGKFNGSDVASLSAWKTAVGQDANSYENNPQFINPNGSSSSLNLHISPSIATVVESNGYDAGVTDDYDGQTRSSLTPVDIGADAGNFTPLVLNKTLNLTMFIEGFYSEFDNALVQDTLRVYLRNASSPYAIVDSAKTYLDFFGQGVFTYSNITDGTPYYLQLKHRNSLETWSDSARSFTGGVLNYNFTTSDTKAYGNNMKQIDTSPVVYGTFSGDENQDGTVDVGDIIDVYNDVLLGTSGYVATDVNGDDFVDVSDIIITYNNAINVATVITP